MSRSRVEKAKLLHDEEEGIVKVVDSKNFDVDKSLKEHLPLIQCECGLEILVVPDLKAMNRAIKTHVEEHREKEHNPKGDIFASNRINQLLSQLTLLKISE